MPALTATTGFDVLLKGANENITVFIRDPKTGDLTDVIGTGNTFTLIDINGDVVKATGTFGPTGSTTAPIITHPSTGVYQYQLDTATYDSEYILQFKCLLTSEEITENMFVKSVSARYFKYAAILRNQVDKARKSVSDDIENMDSPSAQPAIKLFNGYSDGNLIMHLDRGVHILNIIPPYTGLSVDTFPFDRFGSILLDAATISCLESQSVLAIDCDYSYSLGGNSLVIDHFSKLSSYVTNLLTRFDKSALSFKQIYRSPGCILWSWSPGGSRTARTLNSLPIGFWSRLLSSIY